MKKIIIIIIGIFLMSLFNQSAWAKGPRQLRRNHGGYNRDYRGNIFGLGIIILEGILLHNHFHPHSRSYPKHYHEDQLDPKCNSKRIWIPPTYRYTHVPGRYNQHGNWIHRKSKRWKVRPGYWETKIICRNRNRRER